MFKTRIKPSYYDSGYKTETNVLHMSVKKKKTLQACVHSKASAASSLKFKSIFFLKKVFLLGSLISRFLMCSVLPLLLQSWLTRRDLCWMEGEKKNPSEKSSLSHREKKNSAPLIFQGVKIPHLVFSAGLWYNSFVKKGNCGLATETGDKTRKVC